MPAHTGSVPRLGSSSSSPSKQLKFREMRASRHGGSRVRSRRCAIADLFPRLETGPRLLHIRYKAAGLLRRRLDNRPGPTYLYAPAQAVFEGENLKQRVRQVELSHLFNKYSALPLSSYAPDSAGHAISQQNLSARDSRRGAGLDT